MRSSAKKYILGAIILVLFIVSQVMGALKPLERIILSTLSPVMQYTYGAAVSIKQWGNFFVTSRDRAESYKQLLHAYNSLQLQLVEARIFSYENIQLKQALNYTENSPYQLILAHIIGQSGLRGETRLLINQGSDADIIEGDLVTNEHGILIGDIVMVTSKTARVRLLTDPGFQVSAKKNNVQNVLGIVQGDFSRSLILSLVPLSDPLTAGDMVVTARLDNIPENLIIGTVESISRDESGLFQTATIQPLFDIQNSTYVFVTHLSE